MHLTRIRPSSARVVAPLARVALAVLVTTSPAALGAQDEQLAARNGLTIHALGLRYGVYGAEYQRVTGRMVTVGAAVVYRGEEWNDRREEGIGSDRRQLVADLKVRAWSDSSPLHGFAMVLHAGTYSDRQMRGTGAGPDSREQLAWRTVPSLAVSFDVARYRGLPGGVLFIGGFGFRTLLGKRDFEQQELLLTVNGSVGLAY